MDIQQQNLLLKEALQFLLGTKEYKDENGKDTIYKNMRPLAWENAEHALKACEGECSYKEKANEILPLVRRCKGCRYENSDSGASLCQICTKYDCWCPPL